MGKFPLWLIALWAVAPCLLGPPARADEPIPPAEVSRFGTLSRVVLREPVSETPSAPLAEAMDILAAAAERVLARSPGLSDEKLTAQLAPFKQRMNPDKKDLGMMEP